MKFFLGLFFVVASLPMLWFSQFQNSAGTLASAEFVSVDELRNGFIRIEGAPHLTSSVTCPDDSGRTCLYARTTTEAYTTQDVVSCGSVSTTATKRLITQVEDECDANGTCRPCFRYEETAWRQTATSEDIGAFTLGVYTVKPSARTTFVGENIQAEYVRNGVPLQNGTPTQPPIVGDQKTEKIFVASGDRVVVAGEAVEGFIGDTGSGLFVVSNVSYGETLATLEQNDNTAGAALTLGSFVLFVLGLILMTSQFAAPIAGLARIIPFFGQPITHGIQALAYTIVGIAAALLWGALFVLVFLVKNLVVAAIVVAAVGIGAAVILPRLQKKS